MKKALFCMGLLLPFAANAVTYVPISVGDITVIIPIDDPPVAADDNNISVNEDTQTTIDVLSNDSDENIANATITIVSQLDKGGQLSTINVVNNQVQYQAPLNWNSTDSFTYKLTDEHGNESGLATVTIAVSAVNDAPTALPDSIAIKEGEITDNNLIDVVINDTDVDGDNLVISKVYSGSTKLLVSELGDGKRIRIIAKNGESYDSTPLTVYYNITDGELQAATDAEIKVYVNNVNSPPQANAITKLIDEDTALTVSVTELATDPEGQPLALSATVPAEQGTVSVVNNVIHYQPASDRTDPAEISYIVSDGEKTAQNTIKVNFRAVEDPPIVSNVQVGTVANVTPTHGQIWVEYDLQDPDGTYVHTSAVRLTGPVEKNQDASLISGDNSNGRWRKEFDLHRDGTYTVYIVYADHSSGELTHLVGDVQFQSGNAAPQLIGLPGQGIGSAGTTESYPFTIQDDSSPDAVVVTSTSSNQVIVKTSSISITGSGAQRTLNVPIESGAESGTTQIQIIANDGTLSSTYNLELTSRMQNQAPILDDIPAKTVNEDEQGTISVTATDPDGDTLSYVIVTQPTKGTVSGTLPNLVYTPTANENEGDSFTIKVSDGDLESETKTVNISITKVNDPATGAVVISGSAISGETLTADTSTIADIDGLSTFNYEWRRNGSAISGATASTYTLVNDDVNKAITSVVSYTDGDGVAEELVSAPVTVSAGNTAPTITVDSSKLENKNTAHSIEASFTVNDAEDEDSTLVIAVKLDNGSWSNITGTSHDLGQLTQGSHTLSYRVTDSVGATAEGSHNFTIALYQTPDWAQMGGTPQNSDQSASFTPDPTNFYGAIPGQAGVSGGAASYNIPIVVPPGRNGVQPNVSLNYSSRSGLGIAGVGWSLSAGSSISRCPRTMAQDQEAGKVNFDANDRLCLDGQRLVTLSGTYGASGTKYTTEIDSFITVTQSGSLSAATFEVALPTGTVRKYGTDASSQIIPTNTTAALSWLIDLETDVTGNNTMSYHYSDYGDGEMLLSTIKYTGTATTEGNREIHFTYGDSTHFSTSYMSGGKTRSTQILKNIETKYANSTVRNYKLTYNTSSASGRPLLKNVEECGEGTTYCRELTSFDWADNFPTFVTQVMTAEDGTEPFPARSYQNAQGQTFYAPEMIERLSVAFDLDGNGVRDWIHNPGLGANVSITNVNAEGDVVGSKGSYQFGERCSFDTWTHQQVCSEADFDIDGITDVIRDNENGVIEVGYVDLNVDSNKPTWVDTGLNINDIGNSGQAAIVNVGDYNGDGYPDLVVKQGTDVEYDLNLYLNNGGTSNQFTGSPVTLRTIKAQVQRSGYITENQKVQFVGDMNGDGLGDFAIHGTSKVRALPTLLDLLLTENNNGVISLTSHDIHFNANAAKIGQNVYDYSSLVDVNGDGLSDWLGYLDAGGTLFVKLNMGNGEFDSAINLGITLPELRHQQPFQTNEEPEYGLEPKYKDSFQQVDIDGDGRTELVMPDYVVEQACVTFNKWIAGTTWGPETRCGAAVADPYPTGQYTEAKLMASDDRNIYQFKALKFEENRDGTITARFITKTEQPSMALMGTRATNMLVDAFGKGLQDLVFSFGCQNQDHSCTINDSNASAPFTSNINKIFISKNFGATDKANPDRKDYRPIDMLMAVENGVGKRSEWDYSPLSSHEYGTDYYDPLRTSFDNDDHHFNFASSMYTVASFKESNGVGGLNETQYQYAGAVYNNQGRGFRGFKTITERNIASDITTHTDFEQVFPRSSLVLSQYVLEGAQHDTGCTSGSVIDVTKASTTCRILSETHNSWQENSNHNVVGSYHLFNAMADSANYDLSSFARVSRTQTSTAQNDVDLYGNVEKQLTTVYDATGTYRTTQYASFPDKTRAWPNRYDSKTVVKHKVTGRSLSITAGTDNDKVVRTAVLWDTNVRKPDSVTVWHGETSGTGDASTATEKATVTSTDYNSYGLPTKVEVVGDVLTGASTSGTSQTREVRTNYTNNGDSVAADGYFPYQITQENGSYDHVTTTLTYPATGLPKQVTDVSGVVTLTNYDKLARPVKISRTGFPDQFIAYQTQNGTNPTHSVMRITTQQAGVPKSVEYKDLLGRTLRTATQGFDGNSIYQDVEYNHRGQVVRESNPYTSSPVWTVYETPPEAGYDVLGRNLRKITPQTNGELKTTYEYSGLTTTITVLPTEGHTLSMTRTYNSLEQLIETKDAQNGFTKYAYDGSGNPIVIEDAKENRIIAKYDALGRKEYVNDPNMGRTDFVYNVFGELESETDANGDSIYYDMDRLGRVFDRSGDNGAEADFVWDTVKIGLLTSQSVTTGGGHSTTYAYDSAARVTKTTVKIGSDTYVTQTHYDNVFGRPTGLSYPSYGSNSVGLTIQYDYNQYGYLTHEKNAATGHVYRQVTEQDALGNITSAELNNNGLTGTYKYHGTTGQMQFTKVGNDHHYIDYKRYDSYGNLIEQHNRSAKVIAAHGEASVDDYVYDSLHRLTQNNYKIGGNAKPIYYGYDKVGNILQKSDYSKDNNGAYTYVSGTNKIQSIVLKDNSTVSFGYDAKGNQTTRNGVQEVTYNVFNKPTDINKNGTNIDLEYGADLSRFKQTRVVNGETITTYYIGKHFEVEHSNAGRKYQHYISDVAILTDYDYGAEDIVYTHRDRLGSAATMTDEHNNVVALRFFDPFGKPRHGNWTPLEDLGLAPRLANNAADEVMATRRGFTDHEHLDEAELIHMNGRVYDYNVGRFMSVDPVIQSPTNSQSINPYSYLMNNPMSGIDPTGYEKEKVDDGATEVTTFIAVGNEVVSATFTVDAAGNTSSVTINGSESAREAAFKAIDGQAKSIADTGAPVEIAKQQSSGKAKKAGATDKPSFSSTTSWSPPQEASFGNATTTSPDSTTLDTDGFINADDLGRINKELMGLLKKGFILYALKPSELGDSTILTAIANGEMDEAELILYHYTNSKDNLNSILATKSLRASFGEKNARYGPGQYFTDVAPWLIAAETVAELTKDDITIGNMSKGQAAVKLFGDARKKASLNYYIAIDVKGLPIQNPRPNVYYLPNTESLDLTGRIKGYGPTIGTE